MCIHWLTLAGFVVGYNFLNKTLENKFRAYKNKNKSKNRYKIQIEEPNIGFITGKVGLENSKSNNNKKCVSIPS